MEHQESENLLQRASRRDAQAIDRLMENFLPDLQRFISQRAGNLVNAKESSSDLAQSVCREMLERVANQELIFQGTQEFKSWLYRAAVMKIQNRYRYYLAAKRDARKEFSPTPRVVTKAEAEAIFKTISTPSEKAIYREEVSLFERSYARLKDRYREILRLHILENLSHSEIAVKLGISEAHSRVLLSRALAKIAKISTELGGDNRPYG